MRVSQRRTSSRPHKSQFKVSDYLPIWTEHHTKNTLLMAELTFKDLGVTDVCSYLHKFAIPIAFCSVTGLGLGVHHWGLPGAVLGVAAGVVAPAALIYVVLALVYVAFLLITFVAVWAVILWAVHFALNS